jgi:hypothetical protein
MKLVTKYTPIAIALAALAAGPAMADRYSGGGYNKSPNKMVDHKTNIRTDIGYSNSKYENDTDVEVEKTYDTDRYVNVVGTVDVEGVINVESSSASLTSQNQNNYKNKSINSLTDNNALAIENGLQGASGNVGLNIAAGDNNAQDNSAALSKIDAAFVFAAADSISNQNAERNVYINHGTRNNAVLAGNTLRGATGNIAVNIAAGNSNLQANSLAASVNSNGNMAEATVSSQQTLDHNFTMNKGMLKRVSDTVDVSMEGSVSGYLPDATYVGQSDQIGDVYPDTWTGDAHPAGSQTGHIDLDDEAQGAVDLNGDGGALAFNESGKIVFAEEGLVTLGGTFTGQVVTTRWIVRPHQNNAALGGDALRNASGNIGVNIAAGTNNLQGNHLSIAAANGGATAGGGTGGGEGL